MPKVQQIRVFPIKALDGVEVTTARVVDQGGLNWDRRYAMFDDEEKLWISRRSAACHGVRCSFDLAAAQVTVWRQDDASRRATFALEPNRTALEAWLSEFFERRIHVRTIPGGYADDRIARGPTVISAASLRAVASWFQGYDAEAIRRRSRVNLVIDTGDDAFWEDRLVSDLEHVVALRIGDVELEGVSPCGRCVVPTRDPDTAEQDRTFQKVFLQRREQAFRSDVDRTRFNHFYRLTTRTNVMPESIGKVIRIGDEVGILGVRLPVVPLSPR